MAAQGEKIQHLMSEQTPVHDHVPWVTFDKQRVVRPHLRRKGLARAPEKERAAAAGIRPFFVEIKSVYIFI